MKVPEEVQAAVDYVGNGYEAKKILGSFCVYKDFGNGYDINVCDIDYEAYDDYIEVSSDAEGNILEIRGIRGFYIQVWNVSSQRRNFATKPVEEVLGITTLEELKAVLERLENKYKETV